MNQPSHPRPKPVTLSDLHTVSGGRATLPEPRDQARNQSAASSIVAQRWLRIAVAACVAVGGLVLQHLAGRSGSAIALAAVTLAYAAFVVMTSLFVQAQRSASRGIVTLTLAGDVALVIALTALTTTPAHYERALIGMMVVVHLANHYFGGSQAWRTLAMGVPGYVALVLIAQHAGAPVEVAEEMWTLALGGAAAFLIVAHWHRLRLRLRVLVTLFERAEQGDFSRSYDEDGDHRVDAIARVGLAYNRLRAQLASMVLTDPLTACLNRRGFEQAYAREVSRSARARSELALLVVDLDHFKQVNDTYGHPVGDEVLRAAGRLLIEAGRAGDIVARVGGEEFALLLPDTSLEGAMQFAGRLCEVVRGHAFNTGAKGTPPIRVTMSVGVAALKREVSHSERGVLLTVQADTALYAAKRGGRDRVEMWTEDLDGAMARAHPVAQRTEASASAVAPRVRRTSFSG